MENQSLCQSCGMPLSSEMRGTEKNGALSQEYCKYCYVNGEFVSPDMTIDEMGTIVKREMGKMNMPADITEKAINVLPALKRWKM